MSGKPIGKGPMGKPTVKNPGKLFVRLMGYVMKKYKFHLTAVVIGIIISVLASVQGTMFMQTLIDDFIAPLIKSENPDFSPLLQKIIKVAGFYVIGIVCTYAYNRIMVNVTQGTLKNLRDDMFTKMESLPIKYFDTNAHGDIMSMYTNDIDTLRQLISQSLPQIFSSCITIISILACMIMLNIPLTILALLMVGVMTMISGKVAGESAKHFVAQQKDIGKVNGYIEEMMEGQKVIKVFCHEEESIEKFHELNDKLFESADNANKFANILGPINGQLGHMSYVLCSVFGGIMAINGFAGL